VIGFFTKRFLAKVFFAAICFLFCGSSFSAKGKLSRFRLDFNLGNSYQNFDGVSGADFSSINRVSYSGAFFYRVKSKVDVGLQMNLIPSIRISPFVFSDNTTGVYAAKFYQYELLTGYVRSKLRIHALVGFEQFSLKGTPVLERDLSLKFYYGSQISYDALIRRKVRFPIYLRVVKKGRRLYEFTNFPDDPLDVKTGLEYVFGTGVDFEFK